ncbi:MAG: SMI1/KNR4 family protein [Candidatus Hydrogenedentes bacterium]|nr:SMI1/KNR4 family protein [Candidatus Hydrogenedentota bacterium]
MIRFEWYFSEWWHKSESIQAEQLARLKKGILRQAPETYLKFLEWGNGGEGFSGKLYLTLWKGEDLEEFNQLYHVREYFPNAFAIGDDGPNLILLGSDDGVYVAPYGDMRDASVVKLTEDFESFVLRVKSIEPGGVTPSKDIARDIILCYYVKNSGSVLKQALQLSRALESTVGISSREILASLKRSGEFRIERLDPCKAERVLQAASRIGISIEVLKPE